MAIELPIEGMEQLIHGEHENDDISMAELELLEESPDNSPSDSFTEHSSIPSGVSLADEVKNDDKQKDPIMFRQKRRNTADHTTINEIYIGHIDGPTVINVPGEITSNGTREPNDLYTTPDNNTHKDDGNISSTKNRLAAGSRGFGAKTPTSRALDFGDQVPNNGEELSIHPILAVVKTSKRHSSQSQIPYPCRKRKATFPSVAKTHHGGGHSGHSGRIENYFFIAKNEGALIIGNNNKICVKEIKNELGEAEEVEADGSYPSSSPQKSLKVTADENSEKFMDEFQDIINRLHPLRDKGRFKEFYSVAEGIEGSNEPHIQILILIERSMALSYQKEFAESRKLIDESIKMISNQGVKMKNFLLAYSLVHQTGLSRRKNRLTEADEFVSTAKQNEEFIPFGILRVFVAYEHASNLTKMLSLMNVAEEEPWQIKKEDASKSLRECISLAQRVHQENRSIYLQRKQFCLVKLALLNLNCRTKTSRTQPVKEESIHEAEHCIKEMEECEGDMSEALSIQLYVAKSDLCFRKKDFLQAKDFAEQALGIATVNTFRLEINSIQERLEDINK